MLQQGDEAPDFDLEDGEGKRWRLQDLRGQKIVLYFYPADDTPG
jgi:peroxiredoxin Q/BCP